MNSMPSKWPANLWMKMMTKMKMKTAVNPQGIVQWKLKIPNFPQKKNPYACDSETGTPVKMLSSRPDTLFENNLKCLIFNFWHL